jgi:hypothetical protein
MAVQTIPRPYALPALNINKQSRIMLRENLLFEGRFPTTNLLQAGLTAITEAWPNLSDAVRSTILMLMNAANS